MGKGEVARWIGDLQLGRLAKELREARLKSWSMAVVTAGVSVKTAQSSRRQGEREKWKT